MKILTSSQIAEIDKQTLISQEISSIALMERAGTRCAEEISYHIFQKKKIHIFCATGNNGGDGLVIARKFLEDDYSVEVYIVELNKSTEEFQHNLKLVPQQHIHYIQTTKNLPEISDNDIVIDAIFGNGLSSTPYGIILETIQHINQSSAFVFSVDMPSGLFAQQSVEDENSVIIADLTFTFQVPKLALFLPDNQKFVKHWEILDIGLDEKAISGAETSFFVSDETKIKSIYKRRTNAWGHKGNYGHALFVGGSYGKIGASILATQGMLKIGTGLVSTYIPKCGYIPMQISVPEAMVETNGEEIIEEISPKTNANVIAIGSGMGTDKRTMKALEEFLQNNKKQLVIDADAINIIAQKKELLDLLPAKTVLTPHPKELERLIGTWKNDYEKIKKVQALSIDKKLIIIVKGQKTMIVNENEIYFNTTGNNALATGGSGDVLTGIITGLIAQGYTPINASLLGVYLHGKTADIYTKESPAETFIASDIIRLLPESIDGLFSFWDDFNEKL